MRSFKELFAAATTIRRALASLKFERTETGFYVPSVGVVQGHYDLYKNGVFLSREYNLLTTEGMTYLLDSALSGASPITAWYIALYAGAVTPTISLTAATFAATTTEITSGTEGYTQSNRVAWSEGGASASAINNNASPATFTIATATTLSVNGIGILSAAAKGATTGKLLSASRFGSTKTFDDGDEFGVKYGLTLANAE